MSHTPGPWRVEKGDGALLKDCSGRFRVLVPMKPKPLHGQREEIMVSGLSESNARLIAAAPDLLAALKAMVNEVEFHDHHCVETALAAIAKAEGQS